VRGVLGEWFVSQSGISTNIIPKRPGARYASGEKPAGRHTVLAWKEPGQSVALPGLLAPRQFEIERIRPL